MFQINLYMKRIDHTTTHTTAIPAEQSNELNSVHDVCPCENETERQAHVLSRGR